MSIYTLSHATGHRAAGRKGIMNARVEAGGRTRTFVAVGETAGPAERPLILVFHGSKQTGESHRRFTGRSLDTLAAEGRAVVAYLDGYRSNWNDARVQSAFPARRENVDDIAFARAVVSSLARSHRIDTGSVVAVGFSNGGQMVIRLLHEAAELLAGAVIVAATMPERENFAAEFSDRTDHPVPVAIVAGTADPIIPFQGGRMPWWARKVFTIGGRTLSAVGTAEYFARRNGITTPPRRTEPAVPTKLPVETLAYREDRRPPVTLYVVRGGGHTVPGPTAGPRVGRTAEHPGIRDIVWEVLGELRGLHR
jgi:polyhydroxybutyrate depolymerase